MFGFGYNSTTENYGIGTTTPNAKLEVRSTKNGEVGLKVENPSNGDNAYSILRIGNDKAPDFVIFLNSSTRTLDGSSNCATIRNDLGKLRLQSVGGTGIDISGGFVGINVTNPTARLDVNHNGTTTAFEVVQTGTGKIMELIDNTTPVMTVIDGGNVGIGTTSPNYKLQVVTTTGVSSIIASATATNSFSEIGAGTATSGTVRTRIGTLGSTYSDGGFVPNGGFLDTEPSLSGGLSIISRHVTGGIIRLYTGGKETTNERMRIDISGNIGIGTSTPTERLDISGNILVSGKLMAEQVMNFTLSDDGNSLTTSTALLTYRTPFAITLTKIPRAILTTASTSGDVIVDIKANGSSVLGANKLRVDANTKSSVSSTLQTTLATTSLADDTEITMDVTSAGTGAKGLKIVLYYRLS